MPSTPDDTEPAWNNYKIPKSKEENTGEASAMAWKGSGGAFGYQAPATPLADSYYNYPYDPNAAGAYYHNQQPGVYYGNQTECNAEDGVTLTAKGLVAPGNIHQKVLNALQHREKPKNFPKNVYNNNQGPQPGQGFGNQDNWGNNGNFPPLFSTHNGIFEGYIENYHNTGNSAPNNSVFSNKGWKFSKKKTPPIELPVHEIVPDLQDDSLPKDLKVQFQPLFCKLCSAKLSSNMTAKMHYRSKNHEKKIRKWLVDYAAKSGEPLHPRAQASGEKKPEEDQSDPKWFHCEVCDLQLTGRLHAESHYMGRNHQRAVLGHKTPAGQGYYDQQGKWVRVKSAKSKSVNFEGGEDNFGTSFKRSLSEDPAAPPTKKKKESPTPDQYHCDVCNVNTTCNEQLQNHYQGQKHAKKLKLLGIRDPSVALGLSVAPPQNHVEAVPIAVPTVADVTGDLSVYRTPSGSYYCPTCNLTTNSEPQFRQHLTSKNHAKKALQANITDK